MDTQIHILQDTQDIKNFSMLVEKYQIEVQNLRFRYNLYKNDCISKTNLRQYYINTNDTYGLENTLRQLQEVYQCYSIVESKLKTKKKLLNFFQSKVQELKYRVY
jgi:hypothetical protein